MNIVVRPLSADEARYYERYGPAPYKFTAILEGPWYNDSNPEAYGETEQEARINLLECVEDLGKELVALAAELHKEKDNVNPV